MWLDDEQRDTGSRVEGLWFRADDWEGTRRFYREVLGLMESEVDRDAGQAHFFTGGGPALWLVKGGWGGQRPRTPILGLRFAELESIHERVKAAGVKPEVRRGERGITRLIFDDPEGHRLAAYRWELKDSVKPVSVQGLAIEEQGRVLLVRIGKKWTMPGGVVDDYVGPQPTDSPANYVPVRPRSAGAGGMPADRE